MKKRHIYNWIPTAVGLFTLILLMAGCTGGTSLRHLPPLQPNVPGKLGVPSGLPKGMVAVVPPMNESGEIDESALGETLEGLLKDENNCVFFVEKNEVGPNASPEEAALAFELTPEQHDKVMEIALEKYESDTVASKMAILTLGRDNLRKPKYTMIRDGITLTVTYWRDADLNRKFNRGNATSVFYQSEALHQGDKTDVFYIEIANHRNSKLLFNVRKWSIEDSNDNFYSGMNFKDLKERLTMMSRVGGLAVKNGLVQAKEILLEKQMARMEDGVSEMKDGEPGTMAGFAAFRQVKMNGKSVIQKILIEKAPPPDQPAGRFQLASFEFPYFHHRGIREMQPPPMRY